MKTILCIFFSICTQLFFAQHSLTKLPFPINTDEFDEICPIINFNETKFAFTRVGSPEIDYTLMVNGTNVFENHEEEKYYDILNEVYSEIAGFEVKNAISSSFNQEIWLADKVGEKFYNIKHPSYPINNALPNSICSNYGPYDTYILLNEFSKYGGLKEGFSTIKKFNGEYHFPAPITIEGFDKTQSSVNLSMTMDSLFIIISMKDHYNNSDLYVSKKLRARKYGKPVPISSINTSFQELTPFVSFDQKKLFFSSDRPNSLGGMDIYYSERLDDTYTLWSPPKRLNPPVNSEFNDSYPFTTDNGQTLYFSSNRASSSDIFRAKLSPRSSLDNITITINVIDGESGKKIPAEIYWKEMYDEKGVEEFFRSRDGSLIVSVKKNTILRFFAKNRSRVSKYEFVDPQDLINSKNKTKEIFLILPPKKNLKKLNLTEEKDVFPFEITSKKLIVLRKIYFERGKPDVREESFEELRKLASVLIRKPNIRIRIEGHTDNVGDKKALLELSRNRAKAIKVFLLNEGVNNDQVFTVGFGDSRPIAGNTTEEEKRKNRRVEIRIIEK